MLVTAGGSIEFYWISKGSKAGELRINGNVLRQLEMSGWVTTTSNGMSVRKRSQIRQTVTITDAGRAAVAS